MRPGCASHGAMNAKIFSQHLDVDLKERAGRNAIAHAANRLFDLRRAGEIAMMTPEDGVAAARIERVAQSRRGRQIG